MINVLAGLLAGCISACGGAYKDAPYEGFKPLTFLRSPIVGLGCGWVTHYFTGNFVVAVLCSGHLERIAVEGWKIVRCKKPGKFEFGEWGVAKRLV